MKKFLTLMLISAVLVPSLAFAQTPSNEELLAQINALMVQVQDLMARLVALEAKQASEQQLGSVPSEVIINQQITKDPQQAEIDKRANDIKSSTFNSPIDTCIGGTEQWAFNVKRERSKDHIFDAACKQLGY